MVNSCTTLLFYSTEHGGNTALGNTCLAPDVLYFLMLGGGRKVIPSRP